MEIDRLLEHMDKKSKTTNTNKAFIVEPTESSPMDKMIIESGGGHEPPKNTKLIMKLLHNNLYIVLTHGEDLHNTGHTLPQQTGQTQVNPNASESTIEELTDNVQTIDNEGSEAWPKIVKDRLAQQHIEHRELNIDTKKLSTESKDPKLNNINTFPITDEVKYKLFIEEIARDFQVPELLPPAYTKINYIEKPELLWDFREIEEQISSYQSNPQRSNLEPLREEIKSIENALQIPIVDYDKINNMLE
ncbi:22293_t:CDS:2 [Gigaspora margarita]|uniref:22293_t:CDS:1 n=1 Tax=Gigaspora margarita TaxID=4874 RepID=A0ABN7U9M8_GIGMA|nr:22293_t:CDS:2 [Gigaspora margarita]